MIATVSLYISQIINKKWGFSPLTGKILNLRTHYDFFYFSSVHTSIDLRKT